MQQKPDFKRAVLALMEDESSVDHPAAEALAGYRTGDLEPEERARVHRHLACCRECAEMARDLDLFTEAAEPDAADEFEIAASYRRLKPRLKEVESPAPGFSWWRSPLVLAASFALVAGSSWWLSRAVTLAELSRPRAGVQIVDPIAEASQRAGSSVPRTEIRRTVDVALVLTPDHPEEFPDYEVRIFGAEGSPVASLERLKLDPAGDTLNLWVPAKSLDLGDYRLELYGRSGAHAEPIATFRLRVVGETSALR